MNCSSSLFSLFLFSKNWPHFPFSFTNPLSLILILLDLKMYPEGHHFKKSKQVSKSLNLILLEVREDTFLKSKEVSKYLYLILPVLKNAQEDTF